MFCTCKQWQQHRTERFTAGLLPFCPRDLSVEFSATKDISLGLSSASVYPYSNPSNDFTNNEYDMNFIRITF